MLTTIALIISSITSCVCIIKAKSTLKQIHELVATDSQEVGE